MVAMPEGLTASQRRRWSSWSPEAQEGVAASKGLLFAQRRLRRARTELEKAQARVDACLKHRKDRIQ